MNCTLVLNRDYTLTSTKGHSIQFKKGEPTHVPPAMYADAIAIGAQPADGNAPDLSEPPKRDGQGPADPAERQPLILEAIKKIVEANDRKDFTAAGSPTVKAIERELKFNVDGREVATAWQAYHEEKAKQ